jgi:hypothetical protein
MMVYKRPRAFGPVRPVGTFDLAIAVVILETLTVVARGLGPCSWRRRSAYRTPCLTI